MALRGSVVDRQFFHRRFVGMLLCGLFFTCGEAVGQNSSPGDPCSYRLPHYEEDWSCVHNGLHSADPSDASKDVALGERRDSNVSFGGEIRETYERFRNPNFGLQPQDPDGYLLQRYLIHADLHLNESMRAYAEVLSAFEDWRVGGPRRLVQPYCAVNRLDKFLGVVSDTILEDKLHIFNVFNLLAGISFDHHQVGQLACS
jgi:Alginate export